VRPEALEQLERRGWVAQPKADGVYCELGIGAGGQVAWVRYRSGRWLTTADVARARGAHPCRDVIGLRTPWVGGAVLIGELMILKLRDEIQSAKGPAFSLKAFHDELISYGDLPFTQIRRLMLRQ